MIDDLAQALEASAFAAAARESLWLYPAANVLHVLAAMVLFAAAAAIDLRLLGAFGHSRPLVFIQGARRAAVPAFLLAAASGATLLAPEATALLANPAYQAKLALLALALLNVIRIEWRLGRGRDLPPGAAFAGALSLVLWLGVAAAGRLAAYL